MRRFSLALFALLFIFSSSGSADPIGSVYEWTDRVFKWSACPAVSENEARILACPKTSIAQLDEAVTDRYFSIGAQQQQDQLKCGTDKMLDWLKPGNPVAKSIADDFRIKVGTLRALRDEIISLKNEIQQNQKLISRGDGPVGQGNLDLYNRIEGPLETKLEKASRAYASTLASTPLHEFAEGAALIDRALSDKEVVTEAGVRVAFSKQLTSYRADTARLNAMRRGPQDYKLDRPSKEWLFRTADPSQWLEPSARDSASGKALTCRIDARYGRGVKESKDVLFYGSFLLSGPGLLMKLSSAGKLAAYGIQAAERGALFAATSEVLLAAGTLASVPAVATELNRQCFSYQPRQSLHGACADHSPETVTTAIEQGNCALAWAMAAYSAVSVAMLHPAVQTKMNEMTGVLKAGWNDFVSARKVEVTKALSRQGSPQLQGLAGLSRSATQAQARAALKMDYLNRTFARPAQNEAYSEIADAAFSDGDTVFFGVENSATGALNTALRDKDLVTALTNRHQELVVQQMRLLSVRNPGLRSHIYSDFKSLRYAFTGRIPQDLEKQLDAAYQAANQAFNQEMRTLKILRASDDPADLFKAGHGPTESDAMQMAREAREVPVVQNSGHVESAGGAQAQSPRMLSADRPEDRQLMEQRLSRFHQSQAELQANSRLAPLLEGAASEKIPTDEVLDVVRRATPEKAKIILQQRYGLKDLTDSDAKQLIDWAKAAGNMAPPLRIMRREVVSMDTAVFGGLTADFRGLGVANIKATGRALVRSKSLDDAFIGVRAGEREVTASFQDKLNTFKSIVGDVAKCTGDDCGAIATKPFTMVEKQQVLNRLAANPKTREIRMAFIADGIKNAPDRSLMATHGEGIEKFLRKNLEGVIPHDRLKNLTFAIDMQGRKAGQGTVSWLVGGAETAPLTADERRVIDRAFEQSVKDVNADLRLDGLRSDYSASASTPAH